MGAPLVGPDAPFLVTLAPVSVPEPSGVILFLSAGVSLLIGNRRWLIRQRPTLFR
jgi:hypothetical protein